MARVLVWSGATGTPGSATVWNDAYTNLAAAIAGIGAGGNEFLCAHDHSHDYAGSYTLTFSTDVPDLLMSVERDGAELTTITYLPGAAEDANLSGNGVGVITGSVHRMGVSLGSGTGGGAGLHMHLSSGSGASLHRAEDCATRSRSSGISGRIRVAGDSANNGREFLWRNHTVRFGTTSGSILLFSSGTWEDTETPIDAGGSIPTSLFEVGIVRLGPSITLRGLNLSAYEGALFDLTGTTPIQGKVHNCRLHANTAIITGTFDYQPDRSIEVDNSAVSDVTPRVERYDASGQGRIETVVVRTGTSATIRGVDASWRMAANSSSVFAAPHESRQFAVSVAAADTGSAKTYTFEILSALDETLHSGNFWIEAQVMDTTGHVLGSLVSTRKANPLASDTNYAAGTGTGNWTTTGVTDPVSQKVEVTVTPQVAGFVRFTAYLVRPVADHVVYLDWVPAVS
jgi:hypothetical protein